MAQRPVHTIADIARIAGVSKSTVSRALNDSPLIGEETKERIREIAREHSFERSDPARRLTLGASNTIALTILDKPVADSEPNLFMLELVSGVSAGLHAEGYDLLVVQAPLDETEWVNRYLDSGRVDGFILVTGVCSPRHVSTLIERKAPFITWGVPLPQGGYSWVSGDNVGGGRLATEHLVKIGRERIAFLGGMASSVEVQGRYEGYSAALSAAGIAVDPALVVHTNYTAQGARAAMATLLDRAPDLDAVFVNSDLMALAAMDELRARDRRIPDDVAVVGYDDVAVARHSDPPLTTIRQNVQLAGEVLASNLVQQLRTRGVTNVLLPADLVVRKSA